MRNKRYWIVLLGTSEGVNLKKDKTEDIVDVFLWARNKKEARRLAEKISASLEESCHIGLLQYVVQRIQSCRVPRFTKKEREMLEQSRKESRKGRTRRFL